MGFQLAWLTEDAYKLGEILFFTQKEGKGLLDKLDGGGGNETNIIYVRENGWNSQYF